jgi:hypothetical protein
VLGSHFNELNLNLASQKEKLYRFFPFLLGADALERFAVTRAARASFFHFLIIHKPRLRKTVILKVQSAIMGEHK